MRVLIIKLAASGDVVRTTTLLNILKGDIHWLTSDNNMILLNGVPRIEECIPWSKKNMLINIDYDFVINLEDTLDAARLLNEIKYKELFGRRCLHSRMILELDYPAYILLTFKSYNQLVSMLVHS